MKKKNINITINIDDILDRIYAESVRHAIARPEIYVLTSDNYRLLSNYIESGLNDMKTRMAGYVSMCSFNPNETQRNIVLLLTLHNEASATLDTAMHDAMVELLAFYALMRFYGESDTYYGAAWRKYRAQLLLVLARDQAAIAQ